MLDWPDSQESGKKSATGLIDGPAGALEVTVDLPAADASGFALVCHPHPQQGGTKDNKVVFTLARAATLSGLAAVRFNFRGVGDSEGEYDAGVGEVDDVLAVRDWALDASGLALSVLAGFSFGAAAAVRVADAEPVPRLVTVGFPSAYFESDVPRPPGHWLAVYGDADDVIDVDDAIATVNELDPAVDVQILEGAGHFLHGRLTDLRKRVIAYLSDDQ